MLNCNNYNLVLLTNRFYLLIEFNIINFLDYKYLNQIWR